MNPEPFNPDFYRTCSRFIERWLLTLESRPIAAFENNHLVFVAGKEVLLTLESRAIAAFEDNHLVVVDGKEVGRLLTLESRAIAALENNHLVVVDGEEVGGFLALHHPNDHGPSFQLLVQVDRTGGGGGLLVLGGVHSLGNRKSLFKEG